MSKKRQTTSVKVGLELPVARVAIKMKNADKEADVRIASEVPVYLTAVIEDVISNLFADTIDRLAKTDRKEIKTEDLLETAQNSYYKGLFASN